MNRPSPAAPLSDIAAPVVQKSKSVTTSSKYDIIRRRGTRESTDYNDYEVRPWLFDNPGHSPIRDR